MAHVQEEVACCLLWGGDLIDAVFIFLRMCDLD